MNEHEADIMAAFLGLFARIVEQGPQAQVRGFLEGLERELGPTLSGFPLYEPLFQVSGCTHLSGVRGSVCACIGLSGGIVWVPLGASSAPRSAGSRSTSHSSRSVGACI